MRFLVLSDTHGDRTRMTRALDYLTALKPDALLHLGDCTRDGEFLARELRLPLHAVCGNCDAFSSLYPSEEVLEVEGARLFLTHGHKTPKCMKKGYVLFNGHFHVPAFEERENYTYVNCGSVSIPKENSPHSYLVLEDGKLLWKDVETGAVFKRAEL